MAFTNYNLVVFIFFYKFIVININKGNTITTVLIIFIIFFIVINFEDLKIYVFGYGYNKSKLDYDSNNKNITTVVKNNSITYKFNNNTKSFNKIKISTPLNYSHAEEFKGSKIALVKPTFTDAAYDNKFYKFYAKYANISPRSNVTTDLDLLNSKITNYQSGTVNNVFAMLDLVKVIKLIDNNSKVNLISDLEVDKGKIFNKGNKSENLYDVLILGHQEYVTQTEYDNLKQFVHNGGTMIILDGNVFYAEVRYFDNNNTISLVKGHGWAYNGKTAWKSVNERWQNETKGWVGSNYFCNKCVTNFQNNPFRYKPHEEQYLSNPRDIILLNYNPIEMQNIPSSDKNVTIATYELRYGKGTVLSMGIYSDDIIKNGIFDRFFDNLIVRYGFHNDTK